MGTVNAPNNSRNVCDICKLLFHLIDYIYHGCVQAKTLNRVRTQVTDFYEKITVVGLWPSTQPAKLFFLAE